MNSQMAMVTTILPIAFGLFSLQFPAGLVLYFLVSNLWRLGQQELIMRKITGPMRAAGPIEVKGTDKEAKSPPEVEAGPPAKAPGGLRRLFQPSTPVEAAGNGDATAADANGATTAPDASKAKQGARKQTPAKRAGSGSSSGNRGGSAKGGTSRGSSSGGGQRSGQPPSAARRKKRKRR
jgi:YidC/Oxa1 family membrane protein insertase